MAKICATGLYVQKMRGSSDLVTNLLGSRLCEKQTITPTDSNYGEMRELLIATINCDTAKEIELANKFCKFAEVTASGDYHQFAKSFRTRKDGSVPTPSSAFSSLVEEVKTETAPIVPTNDVNICKGIAKKLMNFFSEYGFDPNFRFLNTLMFLKGSKKGMINYIKNYFDITDDTYKTDLYSKMGSVEFKEIIDDIFNLPYLPTNKVNNRLVIYYGPQGTGKTTLAMEKCKGAVICCNSSITPSDLMEDFDFTEDGKATFKETPLAKALRCGESVLLDEINLCPFETLRFLQTLTDGKPYITYKGKTINIADGFKIYGTMNLYVNGIAYPIPTPLADRCEDLVKVELTEENLAHSMI